MNSRPSTYDKSPYRLLTPELANEKRTVVQTYERQDVEVVRQRVRLARLPKTFDGFRIAQLSDIHMGPFSSAGYVRRCVAITNDLRPGLVVLTGDYIAWDPSAEGEVVRALAGLRAAQGIFGCLGNHEAESNTEDYVASLFAGICMRSAGPYGHALGHIIPDWEPSPRTGRNPVSPHSEISEERVAAAPALRVSSC